MRALTLLVLFAMTAGDALALATVRRSAYDIRLFRLCLVLLDLLVLRYVWVHLPPS